MSKMLLFAHKDISEMNKRQTESDGSCTVETTSQRQNREQLKVSFFSEKRWSGTLRKERQRKGVGDKTFEC